MLHSHACIPGSSSSTTEDHASSTTTDLTAPPPPPRIFHLSSSTIPDYSSSFDGTSATSSTIDSASPITLPSLQSLTSSLLDPPSFSASFASLSSLHTPDRAPATIIVVAPSLLYSASAAEVSIYDLASLHHLDSFLAAPVSYSVKSVTFSSDDRAFTTHQDDCIRSWKHSGRSGRYHLVASLPATADHLHRLSLPSNYITVRRHKKTRDFKAIAWVICV